MQRVVWRRRKYDIIIAAVSRGNQSGARRFDLRNVTCTHSGGLFTARRSQLMNENVASQKGYGLGGPLKTKMLRRPFRWWSYDGMTFCLAVLGGTRARARTKLPIDGLMIQ